VEMSVSRLASLKGKLAVAQSNVKFYSEVIERFEKQQALKAAKRERAQQHRLDQSRKGCEMTSETTT
jgi:hypothetical protein